MEKIDNKISMLLETNREIHELNMKKRDITMDLIHNVITSSMVQEAIYSGAISLNINALQRMLRSGR